MKDFSELMKQAQNLQTKMHEIQEKIAALEVEGVAGAGMVKIVLNGKGYARRVAIDPALLKDDDAEILEDLIAAALNDAKSKLESKTLEEAKALTGGLPLPPGLKPPF
jgi:hypothetical protein